MDYSLLGMAESQSTGTLTYSIFRGLYPLLGMSDEHRQDASLQFPAQQMANLESNRAAGMIEQDNPATCFLGDMLRGNSLGLTTSPPRVT